MVSRQFPLKLILLDRDGVINIDRPDSVKSIDEFELIEKSAQAISLLNKNGFKTAIVSNQSIVGRGIIDHNQFQKIKDKMYQELLKEQAYIDKDYYCFDPPWNETEYRKPGSAMIYKALKDFDCLAEETLFIGDAERDLIAASKANCYGALVLTGKGKKTKNQIDPALISFGVFDNLYNIVDHIIKHNQ